MPLADRFHRWAYGRYLNRDCDVVTAEACASAVACPTLPSTVAAATTRLAAALAAAAHLRLCEAAFDIAPRVRRGRTLDPPRLG